MKKGISLILAVVFVLSFTACGNAVPTDSSQNPESKGAVSSIAESKADKSDSSESSLESDGTANESTVLVVYFSRTGEQYNVGVIDEGNTAVVAKMIAEKTGAEMFEILSETDYYPYTYKELTDVAKKEQNDKARPKIKDAIPDLTEYDTIFIGAPVWWGDWPMIMYTFFENADLSGKKLVPFSTHEGSGLSGFDKKLSSVVPGAEVLKGLAIRGADCQNDKNGVDKKVTEWLNELGY